MPAGLIMWSPAAGDFGQFLLCDGRSLSSSDYRDLYVVCSFQFGGAAESFNIPDIRGRWVTAKGDQDASSLPNVGDTCAGTHAYLDGNWMVTSISSEKWFGGGGEVLAQGKGANTISPGYAVIRPPSIALNPFISGSREDLVRARQTQTLQVV